MTKEKVNRIICVALMILSLILLAHNFAESSPYKIANVLSSVGLFSMGAFLFYLNMRNRRKNRSNVQKSERDALGTDDAKEEGEARKTG